MKNAAIVNTKAHCAARKAEAFAELNKKYTIATNREYTLACKAYKIADLRDRFSVVVNRFDDITAKLDKTVDNTVYFNAVARIDGNLRNKMLANYTEYVDRNGNKLNEFAVNVRVFEMYLEKNKTVLSECIKIEGRPVWKVTIKKVENHNIIDGDELVTEGLEQFENLNDADLEKMFEELMNK